MENDNYLKKYQAGGVPVFQFAPVANPYVDMHQGEISQELSRRWVENRDKYDAITQSIGSMQVFPGEEWKKTDAINQAKNTLGSIVEGGDWENASLRVRDAVNQFAANTDLIQAAESFALRKTELAQQAELGQGNFIDWNTAPAVNQFTGLVEYDQEGNPIYRHSSEGHDTAVQGLYQSGTVKRLDNINRARTLMSSVHTDPVLLRNLQDVTGLDAVSALSYLESGDKVTGDKIFNVAQAVLPAYISSTEGTQRKEELTRLLINPETGQLYTEEEAQNVMLQELMSTAAPQIGEKRQYIMSPYGKQLGKSSGKTEQVGDRLLETSPSLQISPMDNPNADFYDAQGNFQYQPKTHEKILRGISDFPDLIKSIKIADRIKGVKHDDTWYEALAKQELIQGDYAKRIAKQRVDKELERLGPDFNVMDTDLRMDMKLMHLAETHKDLRLEGETDSAFAERLYSTFSDPEVIQSTVYTYPTAGREDYAKKLLGETPSMKIVGTDQDGNWVGDTKMPLGLDAFARKATGGNVNTMDAWKKAFIEAIAFQAGTIKDVESDQQIAIRGIRLDGPMPGATEIVYTSPDDVTFTLLIGGNDQTQNTFRDLNEIVDLRNSLNTKRVVTTDIIVAEDPTSKKKVTVEGINGNNFVPKKTETKLFLENDSSGRIVPILKQRAIGDSQGQETDWRPVDDTYISELTKTTLQNWQASGNREAQHLFDIAETRSTTQTPL